MITELRGRGNSAEELVVNYLVKLGYIVLARNYSIKAGEIDIIARKAEVIAFVEVKMRTKHYFNISLVVGPSKQRKIITTALHYAARHKLNQHVLRFDVALVEPDVTTNTFDITFIPNAFTSPERY